MGANIVIDRKTRGAARRRTAARALASVLLVSSLATPLPVLADTAGVTVISEQPLRFGTLVVPSTGSRTITANGSVSDSGILAIGGTAYGPAQFTITYDRQSDSTRPINILMQVFLAGSQTVKQGAVTGRLSNFDTDLPGIAGLLPGSVATFTLTGCRQRRCSQTFRVGARLDVNRTSGGADFVFALPVTASVLAVY